QSSTTPSENQPPSTPESQRQQTRIQSRLQQLQMTDPDDCRANRRNLRANTVVVPPLHFESGGMGSGGMRPGGNNQTAAGSLERPIRQPAAAADPFSMVIPETVLPEEWDAPLQNPMLRMDKQYAETSQPAARRNNRQRQVNQQQQTLAVLQEQQRLRHIAMAEHQERQQQALAVLQQQQREQERAQEQALAEQERLRTEEQERQQQALATLHQKRIQELRPE
ncbi:hypothetical protein C0995_016596, partial [Termitomyces sp. Mi166